MKLWIGAAGALALAALGGCAPSYLPVNAQGAVTARPPGASPAAPAPAAYAPPLAQTPPSLSPGKADQCGASALAYLVGKPRTEIPVPTDIGRRRVVCTTCPRTEDVRLDRQTITYDAATSKVVGVTCG